MEVFSSKITVSCLMAQVTRVDFKIIGYSFESDGILK